MSFLWDLLALCAINFTLEKFTEDVFISRESLTLLKVINLNWPNDFTPYQSPPNHPFFVEFSFSKSGFWAWTKHRSGFTALWCQVGRCGVSASLENFPFHRERCFICFLFSFFLTPVSPHLIWLLTAWIINIHSLKVSWALTGECKGLIVPRLGELCDRGKHQKKIFVVVYCEIAFVSL